MRKEFARFCLMYLLFVLDLLINIYITTSALRELRLPPSCSTGCMQVYQLTIAPAASCYTYNYPNII